MEVAEEKNIISNLNLEKKDTHPLQNLITAPLQAIMDAQITTTETTLDYIYALSEAGNRETANEMLNEEKSIKLKNVEFLLNRMEQNEGGEIKEKSIHITNSIDNNASNSLSFNKRCGASFQLQGSGCYKKHRRYRNYRC